jgi:hypothetical protein
VCAQIPTACATYPIPANAPVIGSNVGIAFAIMPAAQLAMQSKRFIVDGHLVFMSTTTLKDKEIMFRPNSSLTIALNNRILTLDNCKLFACDGLWNGIVVDLNSVLKLSNCLIEDANTAVQAKTGAKLDISNTTFNRNYIGIVAKGAVNFRNFTGNNFRSNDATLNATGNYPAVNGIGLARINPKFGYIGIFIEGANVNIIGDNSFHFPLEYGVVANQSVASLQGLKFRRMRKCGVFAESTALTTSTLNSYNCTSGIYALGCSTINSTGNVIEFENSFAEPLPDDRINKGVFMDRVPAQANINIINNTITATHTLTGEGVFEGVTINNTGQNQPYTATIEGNSIQATVRGGKNIAGVLIKGAVPDKSVVKIINNPKVMVEGVFQIGFSGAPPPFTAIRVQAFDPKVANAAFSNITIQNNSIQGSDWGFNEFVRGIFLQGGTTAAPNNPVQIKNNFFPQVFDIIPNTPNVGPLGNDQFNHLTGIGLVDFENALVCTNQIRDCANGIGLQGSTVDVDLSANSLETYKIGLVYVNAGNVKQIRKNNQWISKNAASVFDAEFRPNAAIPVAQQEEFQMHIPQSTSLPSAYPPNIMPQQWFRESGTNILGCGVKAPTMDPYTLPYRQIATGQMSSSVFTNATKWDMQYYLYARLKHDAEMLSDGEIANFATQSASNNIGKFHQSAEYLRMTAIENESIRTEMSNIMAQQVMKNIQLESLWATVNALGENVDSLVYQQAVTLSEEVVALQQAYLSKNDELAAASLPLLNQALSLNEQIVATQDYEEYRKFATDCYIKKMINHEIQFDGSTLNQLSFIAHLCPKVGGKAVYIARGVLPQSYLSDINDESQDCYPDNGTPSQAKQIKTTARGKDITLFPNPNDGRLTLNFPNANVTTILISNMLGMIVQRNEVPNDTYTLDLNVEVAAGLYHCVLQQKDGSVKVLPFIVK